MMFPTHKGLIILSTTLYYAQVMLKSLMFDTYSPIDASLVSFNDEFSPMFTNPLFQNQILDDSMMVEVKPCLMRNEWSINNFNVSSTDFT